MVTWSALDSPHNTSPRWRLGVGARSSDPPSSLHLPSWSLVAPNNNFTQTAILDFEWKSHLHAGSGYVAELDGDAKAFKDHGDSVLGVLNLVGGKSIVICVNITHIYLSYSEESDVIWKVFHRKPMTVGKLTGSGVGKVFGRVPGVSGQGTAQNAPQYTLMTPQ